MKLSMIHRDRHGRGKECLGGGTDLEDGLCVDRLIALPAHAITLAVDQLVSATMPIATPGTSKAFMPLTTNLPVWESVPERAVRYSD
jgi:hypothetical protein